MIKHNFKNVFLLSSSPRRKILFRKIFTNFNVISPKKELSFNNYLINYPIDFVKKNALVKYFSIENEINKKKYIALSADTIVYIKNKLIGKPKNRDEAFNTLIKLSGKEHSIYTGYAIIINNDKKIITTNYSLSKVKFNELSLNQINKHLNQNSYLDKAGGYAIQNDTFNLVKSYKGEKNNIIGLPIKKIIKDLKKILKNT